MNRNILKILIYIDILLLVIILFYKGYLFFYESDFQNDNYNNIQKIQNISEKELFSFSVIGSAENSIDIFQNKIINQINADNDILFTISTGDSVLDGSEDKYRILNRALKMLEGPALIGIGNAEVSEGGDRRFYKHFGPFYYSFSYSDSYFIFVDTTGKTSSNLQKDWISSELIKAENFTHIFVIMNDSPVQEKNLFLNDESFRNFLIDEFSSHTITCVFTNGSSFEKVIIKDIPYYSSGGAGGRFENNSNNSFYHYLKVDISKDGVLVEPTIEPWISSHYLIQKMESIWVFIHSVFYAQFVNLLLIISIILLVFLFLYKKASKEMNYYRDFSCTNKSDLIENKLNIAMFTNNYLPFIGGVSISINRLANALRERGHKVVIFAPDYPGLIKKDDTNENGVFRCKLLFYKKSNTFVYAMANIYSPLIVKEFIKHKFDIIHIHHPIWMGIKGLRLGKKYHVPVIFTYHTRLEMYADYLPVFKLLFKNILSHRLVKSFAQKCDAVIAPTVSSEEYLGNVGVSRPKLVMPTGVEFSNYEKNSDEKNDDLEKNDQENEEVKSVGNIRNTYVTEDEVLMCTVSRLAPEKNISFIIEGLKIVKENTTTKFKCMIIGTGPEKNNIQKLINKYSLQNDVILIGSVLPSEISTYYSASDLFIFSSISETQGMVLLEAMAGKCPVICVRSSGTDDVVSDGYNGYKTASETSEWAEKVRILLESSALRETMSVNAFLYSQDFSVEKMAEKAESFYRQIITKKVF